MVVMSIEMIGGISVPRIQQEQHLNWNRHMINMISLRDVNYYCFYSEPSKSSPASWRMWVGHQVGEAVGMWVGHNRNAGGTKWQSYDLLDQLSDQWWWRREKLSNQKKFDISIIKVYTDVKLVWFDIFLFIIIKKN